VDQLIDWTADRLLKGSVGVFPKGKGVQRELTRLSSDSRFELEMRPSISDPEGTILLVRATHPNFGAERDQS
jgi:16S rRNA (guanine527-N7)-methyltransferase